MIAKSEPKRNVSDVPKSKKTKKKGQKKKTRNSLVMTKSKPFLKKRKEKERC